MASNAPTAPTTLWVPFSVVLDGSGNGTYILGAPAMGFNWVSYIILNGAPNGQICNVSVSQTVIAWGGRQTSAFAAGSGQTVTVNITGGTADSTVLAVQLGTVYPGNLAQFPPLQSSSLTEISGGVIEVVAGDVTIVGGQGGSISVSTNSPPEEIGTFVATDALTSNGPFLLPPGTHGIALSFLANTPGDFTTLYVQGANTGTFYFPSSGNLFSYPPAVGKSSLPDIVCTVNSAIEPLGIVVGTQLASGVVNVFVSATLDCLAVTVQNNWGNPLQTVPYPPLQATNINTTTAGSSSSVIITAGTSTLRIRKVVLEYAESLNTEIRLQSSSGAVILADFPTWAWISSPPIGNTIHTYDFEGLALPPGDDLVLLNLSATDGPYIYGSVTFDSYS